MAGQRLGHYEITRELGRGGMGEVVEAIDLDLDRPVALKFIMPAMAQLAGDLVVAQSLSSHVHGTVAVPLDLLQRPGAGKRKGGRRGDRPSRFKSCYLTHTSVWRSSLPSTRSRAQYSPGRARPPPSTAPDHFTSCHPASCRPLASVLM